jgi:hypothetical protein
LPLSSRTRPSASRSSPCGCSTCARHTLMWQCGGHSEHRQTSLHPCHICAGTGLTPATSAPGLGSSLPHLRRDWAHSCHICTGTGLTPAASAPGLGSPPATSLHPPGLASPLPHLRRDWAHLGHIPAPTGSGLTPAASVPGLGTDPAHICSRDRALHTPAASAPGTR